MIEATIETYPDSDRLVVERRVFMEIAGVPGDTAMEAMMESLHYLKGAKGNEGSPRMYSVAYALGIRAVIEHASDCRPADYASAVAAYACSTSACNAIKHTEVHSIAKIYPLWARPDAFMPINDAADLLNVSPVTILGWVERGVISKTAYRGRGRKPGGVATVATHALLDAVRWHRPPAYKDMLTAWDITKQMITPATA